MVKENIKSLNGPKNYTKEEKSCSDQSSFILKAHQIINDIGNSSIIHWSQSGDTFIVENIIKFQEEILPNYFRHNRYQSFVRQLNMYDFHKVRNGDYYCENKSQFRHDEFYRSNSKILDIKRKGFQAKPIAKSTSHKSKKSKKNNLRKLKKPLGSQQKLNKNQQQELQIFEQPEIQQQQCIKNMNEISVELHLNGIQEQQNNPRSVSNSHKDVQNQYILQKHLNILKTNRSKIQEVSKAIIQQISHKFRNKTKENISIDYISNSQIKFNQHIQIAELIKDKWSTHESELPVRSNYHYMKDIYHQVIKKIHSIQQEQNHQKDTVNNNNKWEGVLELIYTEGQQDAIIDSIFKKEIRSTLISINSQTFLNQGHNLMKYDSLMNI